MTKKIGFIVILAATNIILVTNAVFADESWCLFVPTPGTDSAGKTYAGRFDCSPPDVSGACNPALAGYGSWEAAGSGYKSFDECANAYDNLSGYCYTSGSDECASAKRNTCSSFFYKDANTCGNEHLDFNAYCYDPATNKCNKISGGVSKSSTSSKCVGEYTYKGGTAESNKKSCEDYAATMDEQKKAGDKFCLWYTHGENNNEKAGDTDFRSFRCEPILIETETTCDDRFPPTNSEKWILYRKQPYSTQEECKNALYQEKVWCFHPNDGRCHNETYVQCREQNGQQYKDKTTCEDKHQKCCKYEDKNGHSTCQCGSDNLDAKGQCLASSDKYGSLKGSYDGRTACSDSLDSEPLTVDLLPKYEKLSQTSLDEINPLTQSKVLSEANTRTPGALVSRLVRNIVFPIAGLLLFLMITWSGFQIVQGGMMGDDNAVSSGKGRLTATIVGFLLLFGSYWLWSLVEAALGLGTTS